MHLGGGCKPRAPEHLTEDMADPATSDLGIFDYEYDVASNLLSDQQTGTMAVIEMAVHREYDYDTLMRGASISCLASNPRA